MNIHALYKGNLARPVPALLLQAVGISAGFVAAAGALARQGAITVSVLLIGGLLLWTLFEYSLHRWLMHSKIRKIWELLHQQHHQMRFMFDPDHRLLHPFMPLVVCGGILALVLRGGGGGAALVLGYWMGYALYEVVHWSHHNQRLSRAFSGFRYFRRMEANHHDHHFRNPRGNYGFTTHVWDVVFGTQVEFEGARGVTAPR